VAFREGRVYGQSTSLKAPADDAPFTVVTRDNYDKIKSGMTQGELLDLLGMPQSQNGGSKTPDGKPIETLNWEAASKSIKLVLEDGKVVAKTASDKDWGGFDKNTADINDPIAKQLAVLKEKTAADFVVGVARKNAIEALAKTKFDDKWAPQVSKALIVRMAARESDDLEKGLAADALKIWATKDSVPDLIPLLTARLDPKTIFTGVRPQVMSLLAKFKDERAVEPIARYCSYPNLHNEAFAALKEMGPELAEKELIKIYHEQGQARDLLKEWKTKDSLILEQTLLDVKPGRHMEARMSALGYLFQGPMDAARRDDVGKALTPALSDAKVEVAHSAPGILVRWQCVMPEHIQGLARLVKQAQVRQDAMRALAMLKDESAAQGLAQSLAFDSLQDKDRKLAIESLIKMGAVAEKATLRYLTNKEPETRLAACEVLKEIGTKESVANLTKAAKDSNPDVAKAAAAALAASKGR
jgi:HEAT repeat protein